MARSFISANNDLVNCGSASVITSETAVTISCWAMPTASISYATVASNGTGGGIRKFAFFLNAGATAVYCHNGTTAIFYDPGTTPISLGNWYHLALTYDSVNGLTGYVNGAVDGTHAANGLLATAGLTLRFGGGDAGGNSFSGRIAQVAEWNVVLTPTEIMALSNGTLPSQVRQTALAGYWPLDGIESPEPDFSGNANNGTVTGTGKAAGAPMMMFTPRRPLTVPFDATIILPFANTQQLMFM